MMTRQSAENVIEVRNLVTHYGARKILDGVDMDMKQGEIRVIMGGSGSGKSTFLWHLLGLLSPTSGSIKRASLPNLRVSQKPINGMNKITTGTPMVIQPRKLGASPTISPYTCIKIRLGGVPMGVPNPPTLAA